MRWVHVAAPEEVTGRKCLVCALSDKNAGSERLTLPRGGRSQEDSVFGHGAQQDAPRCPRLDVDRSRVLGGERVCYIALRNRQWQTCEWSTGQVSRVKSIDVAAFGKLQPVTKGSVMVTPSIRRTDCINSVGKSSRVAQSMYTTHLDN